MYPSSNKLGSLTLSENEDFEFVLVDSDLKFHKVTKEEFVSLKKGGTDLVITLKKEGASLASLDDLKKWM